MTIMTKTDTITTKTFANNDKTLANNDDHIENQDAHDDHSREIAWPPERMLKPKHPRKNHLRGCLTQSITGMIGCSGHYDCCPAADRQPSRYRPAGFGCSHRRARHRSRAHPRHTGSDPLRPLSPAAAHHLGPRAPPLEPGRPQLGGCDLPGPLLPASGRLWRRPGARPPPRRWNRDRRGQLYADFFYTPPPCPGKITAYQINVSLGDTLARTPVTALRHQRCAPVKFGSVETKPTRPRTAANHYTRWPHSGDRAPPMAPARTLPRSFDGGPFVMTGPPPRAR